ncbi:MAG TPA: MarR family transcriptional regulator [Pseudonocardiaceae bacterium]|jgi:DNA-binding MarR family transcriptional regulator|nr:MarR family transcriptional regulator [Pseudonocardiaceae bacterium]
MDVQRLNRLARQLREIALKASQDGAELPISFGELAVVESVARNPDSTITDIVRGTELAQSRVSRVVHALAADGVFITTRDPNDRRQTRVRLDPKVRKQMFEDFGSRSVSAALAETSPRLSDENIARAEQLLDELADLIDGQHASEHGAE